MYSYLTIEYPTPHCFVYINFFLNEGIKFKSETSMNITDLPNGKPMESVNLLPILC